MQKTRNLLTLHSSAKSNPNLILVNTARGGLINEKDVANALHNNYWRIARQVMTQGTTCTRQ